MSATFHGRDIMAPVAARLSLGLSPDELGRPIAELAELTWSEARRMANHIDGEVIEVDSFGNLITNITRDMLSGVPTDESVTVTCDEHETQGIFKTYSDQPALTLVALIGSRRPAGAGDCRRKRGDDAGGEGRVRAVRGELVRPQCSELTHQ